MIPIDLYIVLTMIFWKYYPVAVITMIVDHAGVTKVVYTHMDIQQLVDVIDKT
jgi:hypothetical protein